MIDFDKLSNVYNSNSGCNRLAYFLEIVANEICGCFAKQVSDETWDKVFDFCLTFPEYVWRDKCYDGRCYYMVGDYKVYQDDIDRLLYQGKRKPFKRIYEVCSTLEEFKELIKASKK